MPNQTAYATFLSEVSRMRNGIADSPVAARVRELAARALDEKDAEIARLGRLLDELRGCDAAVRHG